MFTSSALWKTMKILLVYRMNVGRAQYSVRNYEKYEILLLDTCLLCLYLPPDWVGKYLGTYHNNITNIFSVVDHYVQRYMDTLLSCPCMQRYCKYDNHEVVQNYYRFQKYDWMLHQTFCFAHYDFYL